VARIAILDDDYAVEALIDRLGSRGYDVTRVAHTGGSAAIVDKLAEADLVILDVIIQRPSDISEAAARGGFRTGLVLAQKLRETKPSLPIVAFSASPDIEVQEWFRGHANTAFFTKLNTHAIDDIASHVDRTLGIPGSPRRPKIFIVHGHDETARLALKNYLQNVLKLPEPIILHEQPSQGRTLLEKFEHYSADVEVACVLLTPDDRVADATSGNPEKRRARQNVILELGYFLGTLTRSSGKVLLLHKGPLELPSDISGLVYISIDNGIEAAGESIRRELGDVIS
jgi:predicted nucleotide-binding protein